MSNHNKPFDPSKPVVLSTGPITPQGKAIASRNSLKHGCCADTLILNSERQEDYNALKATWFKAYNPKDEAETHMVQELVNADWFLQRATYNVINVEADLMNENPNLLTWTEAQHKVLSRCLRYQTTRANNVKRAQKAIEDYRKNRAAEKLTTEKTVMLKERHDLYKQNHKPEPSIQEILTNMQKQAAERDARLAE